MRHILSNNLSKITFWILANTVGWSLGLGLGFTIWRENIHHIHRLITAIDTDFQTGDFLLAMIAGCAVAILQSAFLYMNPKKVISTSKWMLNTFAGVFLGLLLAKFLGHTILIPDTRGFFDLADGIYLPPTWYKSHLGGHGFDFGRHLTGTILGATIAFSQNILFKAHLQSKFLWLIASSIGLQIALFLTSALASLLGMDVLLVGASVGMTYGMITAIPLCHLPFWAKPQ